MRSASKPAQCTGARYRSRAAWRATNRSSSPGRTAARRGDRRRAAEAQVAHEPRQSSLRYPLVSAHPLPRWRVGGRYPCVSHHAADRGSQHHDSPGPGAGRLSRRHFRAGGTAGHAETGRAHFQIPRGAQAEDLFDQPAGTGDDQGRVGGERPKRRPVLGQAPLRDAANRADRIAGRRARPHRQFRFRRHRRHAARHTRPALRLSRAARLRGPHSG